MEESLEPGYDGILCEYQWDEGISWWVGLYAGRSQVSLKPLWKPTPCERRRKKHDGNNNDDKGLWSRLNLANNLRFNTPTHAR